MLRRTLLVIVLSASCLASAHAQFRPVREMEVDGQRILIDNTNTVLRIEIVEELNIGDRDSDSLNWSYLDTPEVELAQQLFPSYAAAAERWRWQLPSVALIYAKGKRIDDGTYAAVELAAETDFGALTMGKPALVRELLAAIADMEDGDAREAALRYLASPLAAAGQLDGRPADLGVTIDPDAGRKPIGFYTWSEALEGIFRRDTALQERFDPSKPRALAASLLLVGALQGNPELIAEYDRLNALYSPLTNPVAGLTAEDLLDALPQGMTPAQAAADEQVLRDLAERFADEPGFALFQPSESKEMWLLWEAAAAGLSSMNELIDAIREGSIDLAPDEDSGWYEHQQYALEPLAAVDRMPEGEKLELSEEYRALLEAHFRALLTNIRETHVKQLVPPPGCEPIELVAYVEPHLECEPIASTYLRLAEAYEFLREEVLRAELGEEALTELHALDEGAEPRTPSLGEELTRMQRLMQGAYLLTCRDIGLEPELSGDLQARMDEAHEWLQSWREDPDMARDVRTMIPVSRQPDVYWCVIGVRLVKLQVNFETPPEVRAAERNVRVLPEFYEKDYWVPVEQFIEVTLPGGSEPLNREEFRTFCDRWQTAEAIERELPLELERGADRRPGSEGPLGGPPAELVRAYPTWFGLAGVVLVIAAIVAIVGVVRAVRRR